MSTPPPAAAPSEADAARIAMAVVSARLMVTIASIAAFMSLAVVAVQGTLRLQDSSHDVSALYVGAALLWLSLTAAVHGYVLLRRARAVEAAAYGLPSGAPAEATS